MILNSPVPFSPDVEVYEDDEEKTIMGIVEAFDTILDRTAKDYGHAVRSVHAKAHAILVGTLSVKEGLPPELAQGLFANPGKHTVYMRISTNAGDILPDAVSLPRGLALKVVDVDGPRLSDAKGNAQDFVLVNGPVFQARTSKKFLTSLKMLAKTTDRIEGTKKTVSKILQTVNTALETVGVSSPAVQSMGGAPNVDPLGETYFSVTPFRYGEYMAKFRLRPVSEDLTILTGKVIDVADRVDAIRETVQAEMSHLTGDWEFQVQLCRDLQEQPIEDPTVEWEENKAPFVTVATIHADPQDSWSTEQVHKVDEGMGFSVWTGLKAHRPLGNINRARKIPYEHSARFRQQFNRCPIHEPGA
jgi:catalase